MRESTIERGVVTWAKSNGWLVYKLTSQFNKGWPDRMFIKNGQVIFIEFKAPGKLPTKIQTLKINQLRAQNMTVLVIDNKQEGINALQTRNA